MIHPGGLHKHRQICSQPSGLPIRPVARPLATAPDCEQAAEAMPLYPAAAACSPLSSIAPCNDCPGTPARRCCLFLAASLITAPIAGNFQDLTAAIGEPA